MPSPSTLQTIKSLVFGLRLLVAYSAFVMTIIQIRKAEVGSGTYPPACVSMLVSSFCQFAFCCLYFFRSGKGKPFVARDVLITTAVFFVWQTVSVAYTTSQRYTGRYCGPTATNRADCSGCLKGTMGLGWALVGCTLLNMISVFNLVKSCKGKWTDELYDLPPRAAPNADLEKAPAH